jgi:hypothetical protein
MGVERAFLRGRKPIAIRKADVHESDKASDASAGMPYAN